MKILILSILTIGISGCASTPYVANCVPDRPQLMPVTVASINSSDPELIEIVSSNQLTLKNHIKLLEDLINEHNKLYGVECED